MINYGFSINSIRYQGSTLTNSKTEAKAVIGDLKTHARKLNKITDKDELNEAFIEMKIRLKSKNYIKTPIDTVEKKFFSEFEDDSLHIDTVLDQYIAKYYKDKKTTPSRKDADIHTIREILHHFKTHQGVQFASDLKTSHFDTYLANYKKKGICLKRSTVRGKRVYIDILDSELNFRASTETINSRIAKLISLNNILRSIDKSIPKWSSVREQNIEAEEVCREDFSEDEVKIIWDNIDMLDKKDIGSVWRIGIDTGLRLADIVTLGKKHITYRGADRKMCIKKRPLKTIRKTAAFVNIPVTPKLETYLKEYGDWEGEFFFPEVKKLVIKYTYEDPISGKISTVSDIDSLLQKGISKDSIQVKSKGAVGVKFKGVLNRLKITTQQEVNGQDRVKTIHSLHSMRHTFCRRIAFTSMPIAVVMSLMGHEGISMTMKYAKRMSDDTFNEVAKTLEELNKH